MTQSVPDTTGAQHRGPSLVTVAIVFTLLFVASLVGSMAMAGGQHYPSPYESLQVASFYFTEHANAVRLGSFLQFGAAIPLAIFTATAVSRLQFLGINVAGAHIALVGGVLASLMGALSALLSWTISWPDVAAMPSLHMLHVAAFATGGPGFVVPFGLLVAGISVAGGLARLLPRWLMWFGLVIAALAELSSLTLIIDAGAFLLPAARVLGLVWMISVGAKLPKSRARHGGERAGAHFLGSDARPA